MSVNGKAYIYSPQTMVSNNIANGYKTTSNSLRENGIFTSSGSQTNNKCTWKPGSSCQALRHAVAALNRLDDFSCEKIGAGFFSDVYKVTHRTTGQVMVLKMNVSLSNRPNMLREVQLMNRLSHPNILRFMGVCVHEGQLHALTEYINGGSLEQLIGNKKEDLSWPIRIKLALDSARGMRYLHSRGVFHRDLTSKNVLIKLEGQQKIAVIADFGLAEKIPNPLDNSFRLPTVGSPYWMAPECLKGLWYNERADVFSFGIILCELIARVEADPDVLPRTENFGLDYIAFSDMCGDCPPDFLQLAFKCCMIDPKSRPSFQELVETLEVLLEKVNKMSNKSLLRESVLASLSLPNTRSTEQIKNSGIDCLRGCSVSESTRQRWTTDFSSHPKINDSGQIKVTPKKLGEAMSKDDPYYRPSKKNPFKSLEMFKDGRKIIGFNTCSEGLSLMFELPSPCKTATPPGTPINEDEFTNDRSILLQKHSKSLPSSPTMLRRTLEFVHNSKSDHSGFGDYNSDSPNELTDKVTDISCFYRRKSASPLPCSSANNSGEYSVSEVKERSTAWLSLSKNSSSDSLVSRSWDARSVSSSSGDSNDCRTISDSGLESPEIATSKTTMMFLDVLSRDSNFPSFNSNENSCSKTYVSEKSLIVQPVINPSYKNSNLSNNCVTVHKLVAFQSLRQ